MTGEKQRLTSTEWEVCECLWETSPLTITQIANALTALSLIHISEPTRPY